MSLTEVLPEVQTLSRLEKISLIEFLTQELERDKDSLIEPGRSYPVWSPDRAYSAADTLLQVLAEDKVKPRVPRRSGFSMSRATPHWDMPAWLRCCL